ncbi:MAG: N-acetyltransferase [Rhizobiales bacterium]|nr:N-acetyltransferase [Hyphomicrobiales bacterium]
MAASPFRLLALGSLADISADDWNRCAGRLDSGSEAPDSNSQATPPNPFVSHEFLLALEASGCVGGRSGWTPRHLLVQDAAGAVLAAAPCYLKEHSYGEYVFDHAWADAYARAGGAYYPKLQIAAPFTPAPGPRLLVAPGPQEQAARAALIDGLIALRDQTGASSAHVTFATDGEAAALEGAGWLRRTGEQFHFFNEGYGSFEDFLAALASRKRKAIRRERREALAAGLTIERLTGAAITQAHWDAFFAFYMDTGSRKWGSPYLNRRFFSLLGEAMADRVLLVMARRGGRYVAGALNLIGGDALYGRNWGAIEHHPFLHFELCYYQAIDFAIERGLTRVEAGAQGEHKLARGYRAVPTHSAHSFADPRLGRAVATFLARERAEMQEIIRLYGEHAPFRKAAPAAAEMDET